MDVPRHGIAVSPGVAIAEAHCLHSSLSVGVTASSVEHKLLTELALFETALHQTATELQELHAKVSSQIGDDEAEFLVFIWRLRTMSRCPTRFVV